MSLGDFVWYELCTTDPEAAAVFYGKVLGWTIQPFGLPGIDYSIISLGDRPVAGIMTLPAEQMPPHPVWFGYISVADVDAKATQVTAAGGAILKPPMDIPTVGRFAVVSDPQGAVFMLFKGEGAPAPALAPMQTGSIGWHELHTNDASKAWGFYEQLFGWGNDMALDMGPMGTYQLFKTGALANGGMMNEGPRPSWLYYFVVDNIDAGVARVTANGGTVLMGPQEVPGGAWIINGKDPQGGFFALVGMRN